MSTNDNDITNDDRDDRGSHSPQSTAQGGRHLAKRSKRAGIRRDNHDGQRSHGGRGGHAFGRLKAILTVCAIVAALVVGLAIGNGGLVTQGASHVDSTTIKNSFADVAELATQEYDFSNVGKFSQDDMKILDLSIPFTGRSFLVTYSGEVKAGIEDISKATVSVDDASKTVNVTLPQVSVLDAHIDSNSIQTYDQTLNPINQISVDDVTSFIASEEDARRDEAINGGILDKARSRAESLVTTNIRALLSNSAEKDYEIKITWQDDGKNSNSGDTSATQSDAVSSSDEQRDASSSDSASGDASASDASTSDADSSGSTE